jgi:hypothetical protein
MRLGAPPDRNGFVVHRQTVRTYNGVVRKALLGIVGLYLSAALLTRTAEAKGMSRFECGCEPDCWCKRAGASRFRWVTPQRKHHLGLTPDDKARRVEG